MSTLDVVAAVSFALTGTVLAGNLRLWLRERHAADAFRAEPAPKTDPPVFKTTPKVSALIAVYQAGESPDAVVETFSRLDYPAKELVLAIGGAHNLADYAHLASPQVILVEHPGGRKNAALARCAAKATGEILYLTDADCRYDTDSFLRLIAPIVEGESDASGGRSRPLAGQEDRFLVQVGQSRHGSRPRRVRQPGRSMLGRNAALTRAALDKSGGFAEDVLGDDYYMPKRLLQLGLRIMSVPDSIVESPYPESLFAFIRQQARWTRSLFIDAPKLGLYRDAFEALRSALLGLGMIALTLSLPFTQVWGLLVLLPLLTYSYLSRLRRILFATRIGTYRLRPYHFFAALLWCYLDFVIWARALIEYLIPPLRRRW
ncbi:MAG TPA: glycosyltransferase family 2 protein [Dehalococcoidia bacterium]|nr:glycosyltransferase family 2 protein [Dehalococcoidia bacterium]